MSNLTDAIDAIAADLQGHAAALGLPKFTLQLYAKPLLENADRCPILAVYPTGMDPDLLDTSGVYNNPDMVTVGWFEAVPESLESGIVDPAKARNELDHAEAIVQRLKAGFAGIPGYVPQSEGTVKRVRHGRVTGGVLGSEIHLEVLTWS